MSVMCAVCSDTADSKELPCEGGEEGREGGSDTADSKELPCAGEGGTGEGGEGGEEEGRRE